MTTANTSTELATLVARLRSVLPFSHLQPEQVTEILVGPTPDRATSGATLIAADDTARNYIVLLEGEMEEVWSQHEARHQRRFRAQAHGVPAVISATARGAVVTAVGAVSFVRIAGNRLDELMSTFFMGDDDPHFKRRLNLFSQTTAFRRVPLENVAAAVRAMRLREVPSGETIFRQGDKGDLYYIIETGRADVFRTDAFTEETRLAATIGPGDVFGEEALLMGGFRNTTVTITAAARLWGLTSEDFNTLVKPSLVLEIEPDAAREKIAAGAAQWLDCRYEMEYEEFHLPGARLLPLEVLRDRIGELAPQQTYIVYCRSGRRSRCAAYLLRERNIDAYSLVGGIRDWPFGGEG